MKSLFLKIFLWFWAALALSLVLAILVTIALRPTRHGVESQAPQTLAEAVNAYQTNGERGVHDYLEEIWRNQHVRAFVFDPSGRELSGRHVPPWIEDARQGGANLIGPSRGVGQIGSAESGSSQSGPNQGGPNQGGPNQNGPNQGGSSLAGMSPSGAPPTGPGANGASPNGAYSNGASPNGSSPDSASSNGPSSNGPSSNVPSFNGPPPNGWSGGYERGGLRRRTWMDNLLPDRIMRQALTLDGKRYTLILELPPGPRSFFGPHDLPLLAIAIVLSGLVCYLLAWSMTSPVARLRQAAQSLAAGDLTARAGAPAGKRGDELAELMRDFDRMAERIEVLVDSQSRLLKDVSHELRSPLARLNVALGLARQRVSAQMAPELDSSLNRIEMETDRLNQLIQRLLTISRLESGADGLHKTSLSLRELAEQVARDAEYEWPGRRCRVLPMGDAGDEFLVEADPELLRSAIENVIRNATRYTAEGTTVDVRLERQPGPKGDAGEMLIRVLDSGPGVPPEALPKIFQPFYRVDDARNRRTGGAGLGLSIADRAIRLHGGQLRASNRKQGGLEVEIRIPAAVGFALPAHS